MVQQISVFLENKNGSISSCCKVLKNAGINILSMVVADTQDFGILRIVTEDNEKALRELKSNNYAASMVSLVGIEMHDRAGALADILLMLEKEDVGIEYLYSYANKNGTAVILFKTNEPDRAADILNRNGVKTT